MNGENTNSERIDADVLVVGGGLAGLMAALVLQERGLRAVVLDKGRSIGGRLATRRIGPGRADHGAQFFTARTPEFRAWVDRWLEKALVYQWSTGWSDGSLTQTPPDGHPRYAVRGGMNALAKRLAQGLNIRTNAQLVIATPTDGGWQALDDTRQAYASRALLLTPPVPQSLALLKTGQVPLKTDDRAALERIEYAPCLAGMFWVEGPVRLPEPGALQRPDAPISWIADNQRKGISPEARLITVHAGPAASRWLWPQSETEVLVTLKTGLLPFFGPTTYVLAAQLKHWRYALPTTLHPERTLLAADLPPLAFAGDAFGGPRVEGAALSGLAAARALAQAL